MNLKGVFIYALIQRAKPTSADNTLLFKMANTQKEEQVQRSREALGHACLYQDAKLGPYQKTLQGRHISYLTTSKDASMLKLQSFLKTNEEYVKAQIKEIKTRNHSFLMCRKPLL